MTPFEIRALAGTLAYNRVRNRNDAWYGCSTRIAFFWIHRQLLLGLL